MVPQWLPPRAAALCRLLGTKLPIVQGPMAGITEPNFVAACSRAGVLGSHGVGMLQPDRITADVGAIRAQLKPAEPFAINLFVLPDPPRPAVAEFTAAQRRLQPIRRSLGLPEDTEAPKQICPDFASQLAAVEELAPPVVTSTMAPFTAEQVSRLKQRGCVVIGTATSVAEALHLRGTGVDAVVAQGSEAGGHRGTFLSRQWDYSDSLIGTMALVPQIVDAVSPLPVIAAGGIADGRGVAAALMLGASGVQIGTAFLQCTEAATPAPWKELLGDPERSKDTVLTRGVSGRWARGLRNRLTEQLDSRDALPYPAQNAITQPLRKAAAQKADGEALALWAGQAAALGKVAAVADVVAGIATELEGLVAPRSKA